MRTILITGASSGIGLAFLHAYAKDPMNTFITCDKDALPTPTSSSVKTAHHILDITSTPSIATFAQNISGRPIDLVIYSIGVRGLVDNLHNSTQGSAQRAETLEVMDLDTMLNTFHINTASAFLLLRSILPNLRLAQEANCGVQPKVVVMSSRMGSLAANTTGAGYAYRASKAALNAIIKSYSIDVPEVTWVLCHPGRVESALVRYKEDDAITAEESVCGLLPIIEKWDRSNSGNFYDRFGATIQW